MNTVPHPGQTEDPPAPDYGEVPRFRYRSTAAMVAAPALGGLATIAIFAPHLIEPAWLVRLFVFAFFLMEAQLILTVINAYVELRPDHLVAVSWLRVHRYVKYEDITSVSNTFHHDGTGLWIEAPGVVLTLTHPLERREELKNELRRRCPVRAYEHGELPPDP